MRHHLKWKLVYQGKAMTIYNVVSETNWRPIPVVNVDAKIMSKAEAIRIKNVLPNIIHHNQSGFIKYRFNW